MTEGVEVRAVLGIAVSQTCGVQALSVVVNHHRAKTNLVASVPVNISNAEVMIALSMVGPRFSFPLPVLRQFVCGGINTEGLHVVLRVTAAAYEDVRVASIQEGSTEVVLSRAVTIAVTPVVGIATR